MAIDHMDVLAAWGEQSTRQQATLIDLVAGAVLHKMGEKAITISAADLADVTQRYAIERYDRGNGSYEIRLRELPDETAPELPLENQPQAK